MSGTHVVVEPHVLQTGKLKPGGEVKTLRALVGLTGTDSHVENVGLAILFRGGLLESALCFCACAGRRGSLWLLGWIRAASGFHLGACVSDGSVELQELFLVLLLGDLEHGDSVDAFSHVDGYGAKRMGCGGVWLETDGD